MKAKFGDELEVELVESGGGAFEVAVDGQQAYSKLATQRFPAYREIPDWIEERELAG